MKIAIEVKDFTKSYGKTIAVDHLTFSIPYGSITGFVGKNGAGKTTTIRAMMDLIRADHGSIVIDGMDAHRQAKAIRAFVGYMPGDCAFYDNVKVIDLLKFCACVSSTPLEQLMERAAYFELDIQKKPSELSLGNRKKLSIIQALAEEKRILILDEPTNGLDPLMQNRFFELLMQYKSKGKTIFLSSHNLSDVEKYCDRAFIIKDGKLMEDINLHQYREKQAHMVHCITKSGEEKTFSFSGDLDDLIHQLSEISLARLEIRSASVAEEFIRYFGGNEQ